MTNMQRPNETEEKASRQHAISVANGGWNYECIESIQFGNKVMS